jgi:hypothetical protein
MRKRNAPHLRSEVYAGVKYVDGKRAMEMGRGRQAA